MSKNIDPISKQASFSVEHDLEDAAKKEFEKTYKVNPSLAIKLLDADLVKSSITLIELLIEKLVKAPSNLINQQ